MEKKYERNREFSTPPRHTKFLSLDPNEAWQTLESTQTFALVPTTKRAHDPTTHLRIACISDTHGQHRHVRVPKCDVLIHAGDFTRAGEISCIQDLSAYFGQIRCQGGDGDDTAPSMNGSQKASCETKNGPAEEIICIAGNHDITLEPDTYKENWREFHPNNGPYDTNVARRSISNCVYLEDESYIFKDIHFYGSPYTPNYGDVWAFMQSRNRISDKWKHIPTEADVLVTHGPPLGRGDYCFSGDRAGCVDLLNEVQERIQPRVHVFGHIHESKGVTYDGKTLFANASSCSLEYRPDNHCIVIDLPLDKELTAQLVTPESKLSGEEIIQWLETQKEYASLVSTFRSARPLLGGKDLVGNSVSLEDIGLKLEVLRNRKTWKQVKPLLRGMLHDLRMESYR